MSSWTERYGTQDRLLQQTRHDDQQILEERDHFSALGVQVFDLGSTV